MEEAERCDRRELTNVNLVGFGDRDRAEDMKSAADVIVLDATGNAESLAQRIHARFGVDATVMANRVRLEMENGHRFITEVVEAFPGEIQAVSVSKPTLEDVFIHRTGHRFWTDTNEAPKDSRNREPRD